MTKNVSFIDAIRSQQAYRGAKRPAAKPSKELSDELIMRILRDQSLGRMGFSTAKALNVPMRTVYEVCKRYYLTTNVGGDQCYRKKPDVD